MESATVGGMVVSVQVEKGEARGEGAKEIDDADLDGLGIGPAETGLELAAAAFLLSGHGSLAPQRAVGEVQDHPAIGGNGEIEVEREELGELEGFEAIDDDGLPEHGSLEEGAVKEEAVTAGAAEVAQDGRVGDAEETGDLADARSLGGEPCDQGKEIAPAQPVGRGEGAGGEASTAGGAAEALEAVLVAGAHVDSLSWGGPTGVGYEAGAVDVRAVGRVEGANRGVGVSSGPVHAG